MPAKPIFDLGKGGVVKDTSPVGLPENVYTEIRNMRIRNNGIETVGGEAIYKTMTNLSPDYGIHWRRPDQGYNIFLEDGKAYRVDAAGNESAMLNSVDAKYTSSVWQSDVFNGGFAVFINNGKSTPLYALYNDPVAGSTFQEFPNWNYSPGYTVFAKVIRSLGYSLVAANFTINDGVTISYAPSTVRISVQAATGGFPETWLPGLTTDTADEFSINSTHPILDMAELRGNMFIYSQENIHMLSIRGGSANVVPYIKGRGIMNTNCVVEYDGNHLVVDTSDIYTHNGGGSAKSIAEGRVKDYFFANLNQTYADKVFVIKNSKFNEVWVCYPKGVNTECTEAMIYNYRSDAWTFRDLPSVRSMFNTYATTGSAYRYSDPTILSNLTTTRVLTNESGTQFYSGSGTTLADFTAYVEREKMSSGDFLSNVQIDEMSLVIDKISASDPTFDVTVTGSNSAMETVSFANTSGRDKFEFKPKSATAFTQTYKVSPRKKGRFLNYKISETGGSWRISAIGIEVQKTDGR